MEWIRSKMARALGALAALLAVAYAMLASKRDAKRYQTATYVVGGLGLVLAGASFYLDYQGDPTTKAFDEALRAAVSDFVQAETGSVYVPVPVWNAARAEAVRLLGLGYSQTDSIAAAVEIVRQSMPWQSSS